jgi:hypothetical protein
MSTPAPPEGRVDLDEGVRRLGPPDHVFGRGSGNTPMAVYVAWCAALLGAWGVYYWFPSIELLSLLLGGTPVAIVALFFGWRIPQPEVYLCPGGLMYGYRKQWPFHARMRVWVFPWQDVTQILHVVEGMGGETLRLDLVRRDGMKLSLGSLGLRHIDGLVRIVHSEAVRRPTRWEMEVWVPKGRGVERHPLDSEQQREYFEEREGR